MNKRKIWENESNFSHSQYFVFFDKFLTLPEILIFKWIWFWFQIAPWFCFFPQTVQGTCCVATETTIICCNNGWKQTRSTKSVQRKIENGKKMQNIYSQIWSLEIQLWRSGVEGEAVRQEGHYYLYVLKQNPDSQNSKQTKNRNL